MAREHEDRANPGRTSGSTQRPGHELAHAALTFDLAAEEARLHDEESWLHGVRNAKTLVKEADFRVVLVGLKGGARIEEHRAPGRISIHTLTGRLRVEAEGRVVDLPAQHLLALEANVAHAVQAGDEESAFLLTVAWPTGHSAGD